jgi:hypothetical protein
MGRKKWKKDEGVCNGIVDHGNFEWKMYIMEQQEAQFESANLTTAGIKFTKYEKEQWAVQFARPTLEPMIIERRLSI